MYLIYMYRMGSAGNTSHLPQISPGNNIENLAYKKGIVNEKESKKRKHKRQIKIERKKFRM